MSDEPPGTDPILRMTGVLQADETYLSLASDQRDQQHDYILDYIVCSIDHPGTRIPTAPTPIHVAIYGGPQTPPNPVPSAKDETFLASDLLADTIWLPFFQPLPSIRITPEMSLLAVWAQLSIALVAAAPIYTVFYGRVEDAN